MISICLTCCYPHTKRFSRGCSKIMNLGTSVVTDIPETFTKGDESVLNFKGGVKKHSAKG